LRFFSEKKQTFFYYYGQPLNSQDLPTFHKTKSRLINPNGMNRQLSKQTQTNL